MLAKFTQREAGMPPGPIWLNTRMIVRVSPLSSGGSVVRMANGDILYVAESAEEIADVTAVLAGPDIALARFAEAGK